MKDQPSTSDNNAEEPDDEEPVRFSPPKQSMDEYLEYDPETDSYYAPGEPSDWDQEAFSRELQKTIEEVRREGGGGLISRDELLAAGALNVPPAWRKSLSACRSVERDLFSDLDDEDDGHSPRIHGKEPA